MQICSLQVAVLSDLWKQPSSYPGAYKLSKYLGAITKF